MQCALWARPPKSSPALFEGGADDGFELWLKEKIDFPASVENLGMGDAEPFVVGFTVDESGAVVGFAEPEQASDQLRFLISRVLEMSPEWTPAYRRAKPRRSYYSIVVRPRERTLELFGPGEGKEVMPTFEGGDITVFRDWVRRNISYPQTMRNRDVMGKVEIKFFVETDGSVVLQEMIASPHEDFSLEVVRVLLQSPKWTPGMFEGIPVRVWYVLPVDFQVPMIPQSPRR